MARFSRFSRAIHVLLWLGPSFLPAHVAGQASGQPPCASISWSMRDPGDAGVDAGAGNAAEDLARQCLER